MCERLWPVAASSRTCCSPTVPIAAAYRPRPPAKEVDAETLIRGLVGKIQQQGNVEADRLRDAIRRAIAMLQAAVEG